MQNKEPVGHNGPLLVPSTSPGPILQEGSGWTSMEACHPMPSKCQCKKRPSWLNCSLQVKSPFKAHVRSPFGVNVGGNWLMCLSLFLSSVKKHILRWGLKKMSKPIRTFYEFIWAKLMTIVKQNLNRLRKCFQLKTYLVQLQDVLCDSCLSYSPEFIWN